MRSTEGFEAYTIHSLIGASLSEPHTSVTALQKLCVCLWPYTVNTIHNTMTDKGRLLRHGQYKLRTVVEFASGKSMHDTHKHKKFSS